MSKAESAIPDRFSDGTKLFVGTMTMLGLFVALAASGSTLRLAITFPAWRVLILLLILLIMWIAGRWFFLNRDDVAAYTIEARRRDAIDERWAHQTNGKKLLLKEVAAWFCGDVLAIAWLMQLTHRGFRASNSFTNDLLTKTTLGF
jgi:hypothetical protein